MGNNWFTVRDGEFWNINLIARLWISKTTIEIWCSNSKKYEFFNKEKQDDPEYMYVETIALTTKKFNKLKTYLKCKCK